MEIIEQPLVNGIEDHLVEFSEAMRTVSKALRRAAEGKASAQAEASEWKRKYELEKERNLHLENKVLASVDLKGNITEKKVENPAQNMKRILEADEQLQICNGKNGIYSHEVLRDNEHNSYSNNHSKLFEQKKPLRENSSFYSIPIPFPANQTEYGIGFQFERKERARLLRRGSTPSTTPQI